MVFRGMNIRPAYLIAAAALVVLAAALAFSGVFGKTKIGIVIARTDSLFMSNLLRGIDDAAASSGARRFDMIRMDSRADQENQYRNVDELIQKGVGLLVVNLVVPEGGSRVIAKAKAARIPVIFFNVMPESEDLAAYDKAYYVGAIAEVAGGMQGEIAADYWRNHPSMDKNGDGLLEIVTLRGASGHPDVIPRTKSFHKVLELENIPYLELATVDARWDRAIAKKFVLEWLTVNKYQPEAIFANNDYMAMGAVDAQRDLGLVGTDQYIPVIGVDGTALALQAIDNGTMIGTVQNDVHSQGRAIAEIADALLSGRAVHETSVARITREDGTVADDGRYALVSYIKISQDNYREFMKAND